MKSLRGKMVLLIVVISAIPLVLLTIYNAYSFYNQKVEDVDVLLQTRNVSSKDFFDNYLETLESMINYISEDANVQGAYSNELMKDSGC